MVAWNPDVVFFRVQYGYNFTAKDVLNDPRFSEVRDVVSALKNERVYMLPNWSTWSPRFALIALRAAIYLYPVIGSP